MFLNEATMDIVDDSYDIIKRNFRKVTYAICTLTFMLMLFAIASDSKVHYYGPIAGANEIMAKAITSVDNIIINNDKTISKKLRPTKTVIVDEPNHVPVVTAGANKELTDIIISVETKQTLKDTNLVAGATKVTRNIMEKSDKKADKIIAREKAEARAARIAAEQQRLAEEAQRKAEEEARLAAWPKTDAEWDLLYSIVRQEAGPSEEGAWAVVQAAYNRTKSAYHTRFYGTTVLSQLCGRNQFCYSIDGKHAQWLNGNYPDSIVRGVQHCVNGETIHNYVSFRMAYAAEASQVQGDNITICGHTYFGHF